MKNNHLPKKIDCVFTPVMHVSPEDFKIKHSNAKQTAAANTQKKWDHEFLCAVKLVEQ